MDRKCTGVDDIMRLFGLTWSDVAWAGGGAGG